MRSSDPKKLHYPSPPLSDRVVLLRRWEFTDLPCVEEASRDPVIPRGTSVPAPYSDEEGRAFVLRQRAHLEGGTGLAQAIVDISGSRTVGQLVMLLRPPPAGDHVAGVGYWVLESARGRGFATRAVRLLAAWALQHTKLRRLEALVEPENAASRRVLENAGFLREGVLRSYLGVGSDAVMYSITSRSSETSEVSA